MFRLFALAAIAVAFLSADVDAGWRRCKSRCYKRCAVKKCYKPRRCYKRVCKPCYKSSCKPCGRPVHAPNDPDVKIEATKVEATKVEVEASN